MRQWIESRILPALAPRVSFTGELSLDQIQHELQRASFCVMPSLLENFSMACCEAMAAGRAIIVGGQTGSVELIGDSGLVCEHGSALDLARQMQSLHRDPRRLIDLSRQAYARIRTVSDPRKDRRPANRLLSARN